MCLGPQPPGLELSLATNGTEAPAHQTTQSTTDTKCTSTKLAQNNLRLNKDTTTTKTARTIRKTRFQSILQTPALRKTQLGK